MNELTKTEAGQIADLFSEIEIQADSGATYALPGHSKDRIRAIVRAIVNKTEELQALLK